MADDLVGSPASPWFKPVQAGRLACSIESDDPDEFGSRATPTHESRLVVRGKGGFAGQRIQLVLGETILTHGRANRPTTFHVETGQRVIFSLQAKQERGGRVIQGKPFPAHLMAWWRADTQIHTQWPENVWGWNLIFPLARVERALQAISGGDFPVPRESVRLVPIPAGQSAAFTAMLEAALAVPTTVHRDRLADRLLTLVLSAATAEGESMNGNMTRRASLGHAERLRIVDGLVALADQAHEPVSLLMVCERLGVPLRTLNAYSNAVLGIGAARYLRQRRLNRVYHDLSRGLVASVTEAAVKHGFWELGQFAASFQANFGERPSQVLRRAAKG